MGDNHSPFIYNHNNNMTIRQHYDLREKHTVMKQAISLHMTGSSLLKSQLNLDI